MAFIIHPNAAGKKAPAAKARATRRKLRRTKKPVPEGAGSGQSLSGQDRLDGGQLILGEAEIAHSGNILLQLADPGGPGQHLSLIHILQR